MGAWHDGADGFKFAWHWITRHFSKATLTNTLPRGNPRGLHQIRSDICTAYSSQLILWPLTVKCAALEHPLIRVRSLTPSEVIPVGLQEQIRDTDWPFLRMWGFFNPTLPVGQSAGHKRTFWSYVGYKGYTPSQSSDGRRTTLVGTNAGWSIDRCPRSDGRPDRKPAPAGRGAAPAT